MGIADLLAGVEARGAFGVWLGRLDGLPVFQHRAETTHYSASTMKLPVAMAMMRRVAAGELALDQPIQVHNDFASAAGGRFGVNPAEDEAPATWTRMGAKVPLGWLATEMITLSSNLATDLVLEQVGVDAANAVLAEYGSGASVIRRGIDDAAAQRAGISNLMSPADLAAVLVAVGNDKTPGGEYVRDLLAGNQWNGEIPAGVPAGTRVEHKNGWDTTIRHDGGIVYPPDAEPFVLTACTTSELPDAEAQRLIAAIATEAWQHRHDLETVR
ncbi:beta-lactamase class A [Kribbella amoyensis]|uniref:Beta-lactamase class A n=1 Tax=Kribbella amoyensis TaxID=996641 RepID=A0A561BXX0_9ACTN|nr:serine hydrolase [Kribbella amoyensis]TWD83735.1 beta-lactamase class A [Kribbella amoyensis]